MSYGASTMRDGVSLTQHRQMRPLALPSEIMRLENLHGYLKFPGPFPVTSIRLKYVNRPVSAERFVPRKDAPQPEGERAAPPERDGEVPAASPPNSDAGNGDGNADGRAAAETGADQVEPGLQPAPRDGAAPVDGDAASAERVPADTAAGHGAEPKRQASVGDSAPQKEEGAATEGPGGEGPPTGIRL